MKYWNLGMLSDRLSHIEKILNRLRQQVSGIELAWSTAPDEEKERLKIKIADKKKEMQPYEQEYWELISQQSESVEISEPEAQTVIAEIVEQVGKIEVSSTYSDEVLNLLREIRDKLNQPNKSAAAKLKGVISSIPPFVGISYEAELDTEEFLRKNFPTFIKFIPRVIKKKQLP